MTGKNILEISAKDFLEGMSTSPETDDGGFSPETISANIISNASHVGVLYAPANLTDKTSGLNGFIIAACEDSANSSAKQKYLITDTGYVFYADSSNNLTSPQNDSGRTYAYANTDIASYKDKVYVTSQTDIMLLSGGSALPTKDATWWTVTKSKSALTTAVRHPMVIFEDILWIADGNLLHKWDDTTATAGFLTLPSDQSIVSLGVDPSSGLMLIGVTQGQNASDTLPKTNKVLMYDGYSTKVRKAVIVDDMVTAIYPLGGTVYMAYGDKFGYWNGSGISLLRKLNSVILNTDYLIYKSKITSIGSTIYLADGLDIIAFGPTLPGKTRFWPAHRITSESQNYLRYAIFNMGNNNLGIGYGVSSTASFGVFDVTARTTGLLNFYSKKYRFQRPVYIREIHVEYADAVLTTTTTGTVTLIDQNKVSIATPSLTNDSTGSVYEIIRPVNANNKIRALQLKYSNSGNTSVIAGIRRFLISYDVPE